MHRTQASPIDDVAISADDRFHFDALGFLHLRSVLSRDEVEEASAWGREAQAAAPAFYAAHPETPRDGSMDRQISRIIDVDHRFLRFLDHPRVMPYLIAFCGEDFKHIDNEFYHTPPGYAGGGWHRGVPPHVSGYCIDGRFRCPMVKAFYCLTDVAPGQGCFAVVPGSHKATYMADGAADRLDLPGQRVFDDVHAGDIIVFNEALLHHGRPNTTDRLRTTIITNFGDAAARCWSGYHPLPATRAAATSRQRRILANQPGDWECPRIAGQLMPIRTP